jgi:hypothetical protein
VAPSKKRNSPSPGKADESSVVNHGKQSPSRVNEIPATSKVDAKRKTEDSSSPKPTKTQATTKVTAERRSKDSASPIPAEAAATFKSTRKSKASVDLVPSSEALNLLIKSNQET